jgi:hypothetical protein
MTNRRGILRVTRALLHEMLKLSDDAAIIDILMQDRHDKDADAFSVLIECPSLNEVDEGNLTPEINWKDVANG